MEKVSSESMTRVRILKCVLWIHQSLEERFWHFIFFTNVYNVAKLIIRTLAHIHIGTCKHTQTNTQTNTHTHAHTRTRTHTHTHAHTYTYTHTHKQTHTQ